MLCSAAAGDLEPSNPIAVIFTASAKAIERISWSKVRSARSSDERDQICLHRLRIAQLCRFHGFGPSWPPHGYRRFIDIGFFAIQFQCTQSKTTDIRGSIEPR